MRVRNRLRVLDLAARSQLSPTDFVIVGAVIGLASRVVGPFTLADDERSGAGHTSTSIISSDHSDGNEAISLFKEGPHSRDLQSFLSELVPGLSTTPHSQRTAPDIAQQQLDEFINSLSQSDTVRAQLTASTVLSALDDAALAIKEARGQELLSAEVLDARAQLVEALQSVLQETEGFTVEPVDPLLALTRLSDEEQPAPNESPGSDASEQGDSLSATDPSSDELDGFDLDTDQGYEVASGIADLSIASVDPSSLGLGGFLPAGAVGGGGGGGGGVEGVFVADLPSAPAAPAGPSAPSGSPSFSSSPAATPTPTPTPPTPPASFGGRVVDGFVTGATVFYDANNNGILDDAESTSATVTDAAGSFTLGSFTATEIGKVVVLPGGFDTNTGQPVGMLQASAAEIGEDGKRAISSPLSLVLSMASDTISEADLVSQLGIVGVTSIDYYDPFTEMTAGDNPLLAEKVFTVQQQLFAVIQSATLIAGETAGIGALNLSVQTVAKVIADAVAAGELLTMNQISERAMGEIVTSSGYATDVSDYLSTLLEKTNYEIAKSYQGLANGLRAVKSLETSDLDREEAITLVSKAKSAAALSQDTLLTNVELALTSGFNAADAKAAVGDLVSGALSEKSAVFEQVLTIASSSTGPANTEFGNPGFLVSQAQAALQDDPETASSRKDIVDLSSAVSSLTIKELQDLGVQHVRLLGSNQSVDLRLGSFDFTGPALSVDDKDTALDERFFAGNYSVTIRVTSSQITDIVVNAKAFADAGIDILRPEQGTLNISLDDARSLIQAGLSFSAGQIRIAADSGLSFDDVFLFLSAGLKFTDNSDLSVEIPVGDPRVTFRTIQDLASKGVKFTGGEVQLEASDVVGSVASVQAKLLQAASAGLSFNRLVIDPDADGPLQEFDWKLGLSPRDGNALGSPVLSVTQATALADAGILFNSAKVSVSGSEALAQLTQNASQLFSAGVGQIELAASTEITIDAARALIDVRNAVAAGNTVPDKLFSGTGGVISNASLAATLGDLNELLAQGLSLPTNYQPTLSQVIDFVASGGSFPSGFVIPQTNNNDPVLTLETAQTLISAGVRFGLTPERGSLFSLTLNADGLNSSTVTGSDLGDATLFGRLATAGLGLNFTSDTSDLNLLRGTAQEPIILSRDFAAFLQSKGIAFDGVYLGVVSASEFNAVVTSVSNAPSAFTGISAVGIAPSVTPAFSQVETLLEAGISLIRVASTGAGTFSVSDAQVVMRVGTSELLSKITAPEATALSPQSMGQKGIDAIDVLGLDLSLSQALRFTDQTLSPPRLLNARLAITTAEDFSAAAAAAESLFAAGVSSIRLVSSGSFDAKVLASDAVKFVEAWSEVNPSVTVPRSLFNGGTLKGAGSFSDTNVQVGNLVASLVNAGLTRDANYQPSPTEILSYLTGKPTPELQDIQAALQDPLIGSTYSRPLLVTLQEAPTFSVDEARLMASRGVRFAGDQALNVSSLAESTQVKMAAYEALLNSGLKLSGTEQLSGVKLSAAQAKKLIDAGVTFTESAVTALNALELRQVGLDADALKIKGISSVELGSGVVPSFEQLFSLITKSISVLADGPSGFVVSVSNPRQIELVNFSVPQFIDARVSALQFGGQSISMAGALKFLVDDKAIPNMEVRDAVLALSGTTEGSQDLEALLESTRASALYTAGFRKVDLSGLPALSAEDAFRLLNLGGDTSKDFQFVGGAVTKAALDPQTADQVISELKNAGLTISKGLILTYDLASRVSDNVAPSPEQQDVRDFVSLINKGFTLALPDSPSSAALDEAKLSGVFLTLSDINTLQRSQVVTLEDATVVASSQSQFAALANSSTLLSQLVAAGVTRVGILSSISPTFSDVTRLIDAGLGLVSLSDVTTKDPDGVVTLRVSTASELSQVTAAYVGSLSPLDFSAVKLNLTGLTVPFARAKELALSGFKFLGGTVSVASSDGEVEIGELTALAAKGLSLPASLPANVTLGSQAQSLDFVLNTYRGSLKGVVVNVTDSDVELFTAQRVLSLLARGGVGDGAVRFLAPETPLSVSSSVVIQASQASAILASGIEKISGELSVSSAAALIAAVFVDTEDKRSFDLSGVTSVAGVATLAQATALGDSNFNLNLTNVAVDLNRALVTVDAVQPLNVASLLNGRLLIDDKSELTIPVAQQLFAKGLRTIEVSTSSAPTDETLDSLKVAGFVRVSGAGGADSLISGQQGDQLVTGVAKANAQVKLFFGDQLLGSVRASSIGEFSYALTQSNIGLIRQGLGKALTVVQSESDGKPSAAAFSFGVDTVDPVVSAVQMSVRTAEGALKSNGLARAGDVIGITFSVSEALSGPPTVSILGRTAQAGLVQGSATQWLASIVVEAGDAQGNTTFSINATDVAGNAAVAVTAVSSGSVAKVDTVSPNQAQISAISDDSGVVGDRLTNDDTPQLTVTAESGAQLRLYQLVRDDEGVFSPGDLVQASRYSVTEGTTAEAGMSTYTLTVRETEGSGLASGDYGIEVIDGAGNTSLLIGPSSTFTIDYDAPDATPLKPINNGKTAGLSSNFELEFSEQVAFGSSGSVMLYRKAMGDEEDYLVETFEVADPKGLTIEQGGISGGYKLVVNPELRLEMDRHYYLIVTEGAITDMAGNFYAGISSSTAWTFTAPGLDITVSDASALFGGDGVVNAEEGTAPIPISGTVLGEASILTALADESEFKAYLRPSGDVSDANDILLKSLTFSYSQDGLATWAAEIPAFEPNIQKAYELVLEIKGSSGDANGIEATTFLPLQVDTRAPTAEILLSDKALKIGDDIIITVRFSEAVQESSLENLIVEVENGDISSLSNGQLQPDGSQTYSAVFRPNEGIEVPINSIELQGFFIDLAGNPSAAATVSSENYAIDTKAPSARAFLQGSGGIGIPEVVVVPLESQTFPEDLSRIDIQVGLGNPVFSVNLFSQDAPQEASFTIDTSNLGLNPDSVLAVLVSDAAGNQSRIPVEINNPEDLFFGAVQNGLEARANFSNLGLLAAQAGERSSFAFIDAGLGYVISDDAALNNLEIAESLGVMGSMGDDYMVARDQGSVLAGGSGNDTLLGGLSQDYLDGGDGDDIFVPLGAADVIRTGSGNDLIEISADAFYEQISRAQMEDLLLRVTQADQADVKSILDEIEVAQSALVGVGATFANRLVGVVQDFNFKESEFDTDYDSVVFSGFSSADRGVDITLEDGAGKLSYRFVKEFANPTGSGDPDYIFTSIMLSSDANAWTMAAVDQHLSETAKSQ